jgi:hypothetical protein
MVTGTWVGYVKHRRNTKTQVLDLVETTMLSLLLIGLGALGILGVPPELAPIFSGIGPGPVFSVFFLVFGCLILARTWLGYLKHRRDAQVTVFALVLANMVSLLFIVGGVIGVVRWAGTHFVGRAGG